MTPDDVMKFLAITVVILLPVLTLTLAIAARFALKPIAESIVQIRKMFAAERHEPVTIENDQIRLLHQEVADLRIAVEQLRDVVEFERALSVPKAKALPPQDD